MEVALTFGSLGDIIAVCQIAIQLGRAIASSQYGSSSEFQGLKKDLDVFVKVLMQVRPPHTIRPWSPFMSNRLKTYNWFPFDSAR